MFNLFSVLAEEGEGRQGRLQRD